MERKVNLDNYNYKRFLEYKYDWKWYLLEIGESEERFGKLYKIFIVKDNELKDITYFINHYFFKEEKQLFHYYGYYSTIKGVIFYLKMKLELINDIEVL